MTAGDLAAHRATLGLTQGALATKLGVSRRAIQQWEAAERAIPEIIARVMRLAALDTEILDRLESSKI